jgi:hypothetical protein
VSIALIALSVVLAAMIGGFLWFYYYSRTPAWGESETRKAMLNLLVVVGPIFGMHYRPPRPEPPTISAPGPDETVTPHGAVIPPQDPGATP